MDKRVILIIEDSADDQLLLRSALMAAGVNNPVVFVEHNQEAKAYLTKCERTRKGMPALIFLDVLLPDEDGLVFLEGLRKNPVTHPIPVIVFTQSHQRQHREDSYQLGANSFVSKDGSLSEFNAKIKCICDYWLQICQLPVA